MTCSINFYFFSAKITIFHGIFLGTSDRESGVPVVLNFTGTDNFLCCTNKIEDIEEKILQIKVRFNNLLFFYFARVAQQCISLQVTQICLLCPNMVLHGLPFQLQLFMFISDV